jgi:hypothetical protein
MVHEALFNTLISSELRGVRIDVMTSGDTTIPSFESSDTLAKDTSSSSSSLSSSNHHLSLLLSEGTSLHCEKRFIDLLMKLFLLAEHSLAHLLEYSEKREIDYTTHTYKSKLFPEPFASLVQVKAATKQNIQ